MAGKWFEITTTFRFNGAVDGEPEGRIHGYRLGRKATTEQAAYNRKWCEHKGHTVLTETITPLESNPLKREAAE